MSELKDAALDYSARGFRVIPVEPRGKKPLVQWKEYQHAQASPEQVSHWWDEFPNANVALVLGGGLFAVDVDGPAGHQALADAGITIPSGTPASLTGRGLHYIFQGDQADRVGFLPQVDIRGRGIIIAPPSIHTNGKTYTWLQDLSTLSEAPFTLLSLLAKPMPAPGPNGAGWLVESLNGVGEGQRDATCTRLAGYYLSKGMPRDVVISTLLAWARGCMPPLPAHDVIKCVDSIAQKEGPHRPLEITSIDTLYTEAPDSHEWILPDYIPLGALVLLASEEKVGKSTFVYAMAAAIAQGRRFLDREVRQSRVLILAVEEHKTDVKLRSVKFGLRSGDGVEYLIGNLGTDAGTHEKLKQYVMDNGINLVILDTMGHYLSGSIQSENDNYAMLQAMKPFLALARDTRAAVLIVHHTGKGAIQAYRGASAIGGIVDQVLTLRSDGGNTRILDSKGRYADTPERIWIRLDDNVYTLVHTQRRGE